MNNKKNALVTLSATLLALMSASFVSAAQQAPALTPEEARSIAKEAYVYGFPMVDHYRIQHAFFVDRAGAQYKAPWNTLHSEAQLFTPQDTAIQTPNADTPYSQLGADLRAEPLVLSMPEVEPGRYYAAQFVDAYTHNFAYVGSRTTGNGAGDYLLAGPDWKGPVPKGIKQVLRSETEFAFVFYRTQLFGPQDLEAVRKVQAGFRVRPLSAYLGQPAPTAAPAVAFIQPLSVEEERSSLDFFKILNFLLGYCPTHPSERELMQRFARLNIGAGQHFDPAALRPEIRQAIEAGIGDAWKAQDQLQALAAAGKLTSADLTGDRAALKNNYLYRMRAAMAGIYGNSKEEAVYPVYYQDAGGQRLDGSHAYVLRFAPGQLPPVNAFWSLTMYQLPSRLLVANPLDRYLINSPMLPQLKRDADGGITLYIQHASPGKALESNWLPAPKGPFVIAMRLFWPKAAALDGEWSKPALQVNAAVAGQP
ncbi:DUF1254 domain-containing protein [Pseudomonas nicosulfuronedens]